MGVKAPNKRQPLLPKKRIVTNSNVQKKESPKKEVVSNKKSVKNDESSNDMDNIKQWKDWLGLSSENAEDAEFIFFAEDAAKSSLPDDWEKVNDNLYHNIRTNERTMTHPLLMSMQ